MSTKVLSKPSSTDLKLKKSFNVRSYDQMFFIHTVLINKKMNTVNKKRICDILRGFMPRFQNTITMSQRLWWWYFMIRAKAQCILNL